MNPTILGIHHVTAITADAQRNIDFYTGILGLRLVKLTVNFDDPTSYHLYYGDELGRPGSILTFFAWAGAHRGRQGTAQVGVASLSIPAASVSYWKHRLAEQGIAFEDAPRRMGEEVIGLADPDGMRLELIGAPEDLREPWPAGPVPPGHAVRGVHSVTLTEEGYERTADMLTQTLGFRAATADGASETNRFRYAVGDGGPGAIVDVLCVPGAPHGTMGAGTVHHVAWRTPDDAQQGQWRELLAGRGHNVSPIMDRQYFHSIYFREPRGVLFEIATDPPGFTVNEPADKLGQTLFLPPWLEEWRPKLQQVLQPLRLPGAEAELVE